MKRRDRQRTLEAAKGAADSVGSTETHSIRRSASLCFNASAISPTSVAVSSQFTRLSAWSREHGGNQAHTSQPKATNASGQRNRQGLALACPCRRGVWVRAAVTARAGAGAVARVRDIIQA